MGKIIKRLKKNKNEFPIGKHEAEDGLTLKEF